MRNIEFRGKPKDKSACACAEDNGFVYGGIAFDGCTDETYITRWNSFGLGFIENVEVDPSTVGQFTGLTDRNGKRIYEGDIVMCPENECGVPEYEAVPWDYNCFSCMKVSWSKYYEVVGNIHDNPELLN